MCKECGCGLDTGFTCPECSGRMVLINNQMHCLECGATPAAHEEHHQHEHTGGEMGALDHLAGLRILLPHWIEHNEEHVESLRQWAARAAEMGWDMSAQQIEAAVAHIAACNQALRAALKSLGGVV